MNELTRFSLLNPDTVLIEAGTKLSGPFYAVRALEDITFTTFSKRPCLNAKFTDDSIDMSVVELSANDVFEVPFTDIELATGSALVYIAGERKV